MLRWMYALLLVPALLFASPPPAHAAAKPYWAKVKVRPGSDAKRVAKHFRRLLRSESKRAKWGKRGKVNLSARVVKLSWEDMGDVLRVSVTVVAKIEGGKGARSKIRIGGHPKKKRDLEKQALKIVASGLVTRLSDISRHSKATAPKPKKPKPVDPEDEG